MTSLSRRQILGSIGLAAGAGLWSHFSRDLASASSATGESAQDWKYAQLDPNTIADDAYRLFADGGCMYGLCGAVVTGLANKLGEPFRSFPLHMMRYGAGGVGGWGSLCGTLNGAAAVIGLVEPRKDRRTQLVAELFSWYEATALPTYSPKGHDQPSAFIRSASQSVLCHVSVHRWCEAADSEVESDLMKERCRRLTADVAAKTVELLNRRLQGDFNFADIAPDVKSCISCHGHADRADTFGTMRCNTCHQLSKDHPEDK